MFDIDIDIEINVQSKETLEYENAIMEKIPHTDKYLLNAKTVEGNSDAFQMNYSVSLYFFYEIYFFLFQEFYYYVTN